MAFGEWVWRECWDVNYGRDFGVEKDDSAQAPHYIFEISPQWANKSFHAWFWRHIMVPHIALQEENPDFVAFLHAHCQNQAVSLESSHLEHLLHKHVASLSQLRRSYCIFDRQFYSQYQDSYLRTISQMILNLESTPEHISLLLPVLHRAGILNSLTKSDYMLYPREIESFYASLLHVTNVHDWAHVSQDQLHRIVGVTSGPFLDDKFRIRLLERVYGETLSLPTAPQLGKTKKATQKLMLNALRQIFPDQEMPENHAFRPEAPIHVQAYFPVLKLAVQYLGEQHFMDVQSFPLVEAYRRRDADALDYLSGVEGLNVLQVPYWWDGSVEQLRSTLRERFGIGGGGNALPIPKTFQHTPSQSSTHLIWDGTTNISSHWCRPNYNGIVCEFSSQKGLLTQTTQKPVTLPPRHTQALSLLREHCLRLKIPPQATLRCVLTLDSPTAGYSEVGGLIRAARNGTADFDSPVWNQMRIILTNVEQPDEKMPFAQGLSHLHAIRDKILTQVSLPMIRIAPWRQLRGNVEAEKLLHEADATFILASDTSTSPREEQRMRRVHSVFGLYLGKVDKMHAFNVRLTDSQDEIHVMVLRDDYLNADLMLTENASVVEVMYAQKHPTSGRTLRPTVVALRTDLQWKDVVQSNETVSGRKSHDTELLIMLKSILSREPHPPQTLQDKITLIERAVQQSQNIYPSMHDREEIASLLQIQSHENLSQILTDARLRKRHHVASTADEAVNQRQYIRDWLKARDMAPPSTKEIAQLHTEIGLPRRSISRLIAYELDHKGDITDEKKHRIAEFLRERDFEKPEKEDIDALQKELNLGRAQIHKQVSMMLDEQHNVTQEKRDIVKKWLVANSYASPTADQVQQLMREAQLGRQQVYSLVSRFKDVKGVITDEKVGTIRDYLQEHKDAIPPSQIELWQQELQLSRKQVHDIVNRFLDPAGEITEEKKSLIAQRASERTSISATLLRELCDLTNLNKSQVRGVLRGMRQKTQHGEITAEKKQFIEDYLLARDSNAKGGIDWEHLMRHTQLSRAQVQRLVSSIRDVRGNLTEEKVQHLREWVEANGKPNKQQILELQADLLLSRSQIQEYTSKILDPGTRLTPEKRVRVLEGFGGMNAVGELSDQLIAQLQKETELSRRQIQHLWRQHCRKEKRSK